jgi:hypothetical protein
VRARESSDYVDTLLIRPEIDGRPLYTEFISGGMGEVRCTAFDSKDERDAGKTELVIGHVEVSVDMTAITDSDANSV